jgi:hypothetical protein
MAEKVEGSFCFTVLSRENELYIVKGDNPMAIARFDGYYIYASTEAILKKALKRLNLRKFEMIEIDDGEIFKFDTNGNITKSEFEMKFNYTFPTYRWRSSFTKAKSVNKNFNDEYLEDLLYYASFIGVDEDVVMLSYEVFNIGYSTNRDSTCYLWVKNLSVLVLLFVKVHIDEH